MNCFDLLYKYFALGIMLFHLRLCLQPFFKVWMYVHFIYFINVETALIAIGFNHGLPWYVKNMSWETQVDKNRGCRPRFLSWLRPEGHVFNIPWQAKIKTYYCMFPLWFNRSFFHKNVRNSRIRMLWSPPDPVARQNSLLLWVGCLATYINWKVYVHLSMWHSGC